MQKCGNTHSLPTCADLIQVYKALLFGVVLGNLQCAVKELPKINRLAHNLFRSRGLSGLQKIPAADLNRRKTYLSRDAIHVPFHGKQALGRSKAAKSSMGRRVRSNRFRADSNTRPVVRSASMNCPA